MRSCLACAVLALAADLGAQPSISANGVVNATGYQAKLTPGAVFVIFGNGMGPGVLMAAAPPDYPASLSGTSVSFTPAEGGAVAARIIYTVAGQVAGLLPSSIAPGVYAVRVTYNGQTSPPQNVTVVAHSFGIATADSSGSGTAQATVGNVNGGISLVRFTSGAVVFNGFNYVLGPSHPGDTLVLWGTGGGADAANDTGGTSGDQTAAGSFVVLVAGRRITPVYAGASAGYPGLWQINFVLPADIEPDCFATIQVLAGGEAGNLASIPIAAPGQVACTNPDVPQEILAKVDSGADMTLGAFAVARLHNTTANVTVETASGWVARTKAAKFAKPVSGPHFGFCRVYERTFPANGLDPAFPDAFLDAGASLPLSGPGVAPGTALAKTNGPVGPFYAGGPGAPFTAGLYTLSGSGGGQVGPFSASTNFPASFLVSNWDAITGIDRAQPLVVIWSGGGFERVSILITNNEQVGGRVHIVSVNCENIPAALGSYSVPSEALAYLLAGAANLTVHGINQVAFSAPLTGGGRTDLALFNADLGMEKSVPVR